MRSEHITFVASALAIALAGTTFANMPIPSCQGTSSWNYGGSTCGCSAVPNASLRTCLRCCNAMPPEAGNVICCYAFCKQAVFPCISMPSFWWPF